MVSAIRYVPLVLVAIIILSQAWIFFLVYCPEYHPVVSDEPVFYFMVWPLVLYLLVSLTINWIRCIMVDPGVIDRDDYLNNDEIDAIKRDCKATKEKEFTIKKYLSIDPLRFKLPFEPVEEYERQYAGMSTKELRYELSQSIYNNIEKYSFCTKCKLVRPPRAHHCKVYGRCIDRMDHWCPWVATTVARKNHKFFILFTGYASSALLIASFLQALSYYFIDPYRKISYEQDLAIKIGIWVKLVVGSAIGYLFVYQAGNSINNVTTVEDHVEQMAYRNPFDKGNFIDNLAEIFGKPGISWFLPSKPVLEEGQKGWHKLSYANQ